MDKLFQITDRETRSVCPENLTGGKGCGAMTPPALFEITMKTKYSEDNVNAQMYDIIRNTITFDLGRIFGANLNYLSDYYNLAIVNQTPWASTVESRVKVLEAKMETIVNKLSEIE